MTAYLWTSLVIYVISILSSLINLGKSKYPITREKTAGEDVFGLILASGFLGWVIYLLNQ